MNKKATLHTDGGARGNPGPAGIGAVVDFEDKQYLLKEYIGEGTNNQAEYKAVILGLEKAKELGAEEVDVYLDSLLVKEQLSQNYKVKNQDLQTLFVQAWNLSSNFKKIKYIHIPREENKAADKLVNEALDAELGKLDK